MISYWSCWFGPMSVQLINSPTKSTDNKEKDKPQWLWNSFLIALSIFHGSQKMATLSPFPSLTTTKLHNSSPSSRKLSPFPLHSHHATIRFRYRFSRRAKVRSFPLFPFLRLANSSLEEFFYIYIYLSLSWTIIAAKRLGRSSTKPSRSASGTMIWPKTTISMATERKKKRRWKIAVWICFWGFFRVWWRRSLGEPRKPRALFCLLLYRPSWFFSLFFYCYFFKVFDFWLRE